jgi:hypothetical protein
LTIGNTLQCPNLNDTIFLSFSSLLCFHFHFYTYKAKKNKNKNKISPQISGFGKIGEFLLKKNGFPSFSLNNFTK